MDTTTQTHLTTLRNLLTYRQHELQAEVHAAELARRGAAGATGEVGDLEDSAAQEQLSDVSEAEEQRDVDELARVERALHRLDHGVYGDCAECAQPIPLPRLLAQPAAERCAPCQAAVERASHSASGH